MALPAISMREMIESGAHFGHKTRRWNPRMAPYLYGIRNDVHIIDLQQTVPLLNRALQAVKDVVSQNGRVLFVGTKPQASAVVAEYAKRCGQYYVNHRWLGGMLTNWNTVFKSIKRLKMLEETLNQEVTGYTKSEELNLRREMEKMERALGGIKDMGGIPDLIFVIDTNREGIAVKEAQKLDIPVVAIVDSNSDPYGITYPVPGNDDSIRAIGLYCRLVSDAVLDGIQDSLVRAGVDLGSSEAPVTDITALKEKVDQAKAARSETRPLKGKGNKAAAAEGQAEAPAEGEEKKAKGGKKAAAAPVVEKKPTRKKSAKGADAEQGTDAEAAAEGDADAA